MKIKQRNCSSDADFSTEMHPVLQRIYAARGVGSDAELEYGLAKLARYQSLKGIGDAVDLLLDAINENQRVLIVADFDADGATSCAVAIRGLRQMGISDLHYVVPNRFEYGYGLTPEIVAVAAEKTPDLLITVDNGIASIEGVAEANLRGIKVLITDHHLPGKTLPDAAAIVNPSQPGDEFSSKALCGVGVMFYLLLALRARLRELQWFEQTGTPAPNLAHLLDLVALGTVADVVPLDYNNRILVSQGMARIRNRHCCAGIKAIAEVAKRDLTQLVSTDLGFAIGPRLNAAGRLTDMSVGIECLLTDDEALAKTLADQLDQLNRERREIGDQMLEEAVAIIDALPLESDQMAYGLCLFDPEWHQGVVGILASKIKEQWHRPVIVFALTETGEMKGSARSVKGVHIRDVLDVVATRHPELISKFGGHAMAAGLSLQVDKYPAFCEAFDQAVREVLSAEAIQGEIQTDGELDPDHINLSLAEVLRAAGPWGQGFPEPVFSGQFEIEQARIVGEKHLKLLLRLSDSDQLIDGIAFFTSNADWPENTRWIEIVYQLDVNEFRGNRSTQLIVRQITSVQ